jgi:hypothetical protein
MSGLDDRSWPPVLRNDLRAHPGVGHDRDIGEAVRMEEGPRDGHLVMISALLLSRTHAPSAGSTTVGDKTHPADCGGACAKHSAQTSSARSDCRSANRRDAAHTTKPGELGGELRITRVLELQREPGEPAFVCQEFGGKGLSVRSPEPQIRTRP